MIATSASNQAIQGCAIFARFAGSAYSRRDPRVALAALAHPGQHSDAARRLVDGNIHDSMLVQRY